MAWILENQRRIRWTILVLLVVAILGPWGFDRINVPAEYPCNLPFIRLEGDFCGLPISGLRSLGWMIGGFFNVAVRLITGEVDSSEVSSTFGFSLVVILLLLPIFNLLFILRRREQRRFQVFHLLICALDVGLLLVFGLFNHPKSFYALWGIWLYIAAMIGILILEVILIKSPLSKTHETG